MTSQHRRSERCQYILATSYELRTSQFLKLTAYIHPHCIQVGRKYAKNTLNEIYCFAQFHSAEIVKFVILKNVSTYRSHLHHYTVIPFQFTAKNKES